MYAHEEAFLSGYEKGDWMTVMMNVLTTKLSGVVVALGVGIGAVVWCARRNKELGEAVPSTPSHIGSPNSPHTPTAQMERFTQRTARTSIRT